jgi:hypothetical protein
MRNQTPYLKNAPLISEEEQSTVRFEFYRNTLYSYGLYVLN